MATEEAKELTLFLQEKEGEILSSWLENVRQLTVISSAETDSDHNPYQDIISTCYPEIVHYILSGADSKLLDWVKTVTHRGYPSGFPLKHVLQGHSVLREVIKEKLWERQKERGWDSPQLKLYEQIIDRLVDGQLQKISDFYLKVYHDELLNVERKHYQLNERMPEVIYSYSPQKGLVFVSQASQRLLGRSPEEFYKYGFQLWVDHVHPSDRENFLLNFQHQLENQQELEYEYRLLHKNGADVLHVINRSIPIADSQGNLISIDGIVIDITERKKMEQEIRNRNTQLENLMVELQKTNQEILKIGQRKSELVNIVAHDLRNPLNSIRIFTELLLTYKNSPEDYEDFLHRIDEETNRLMNLIDNFLDIEKIEAGLIHYKNENVDLSEIIEHFRSICKWEMDKKQLTFTTENLDQLQPVKGDPARLSQVFSNLFGNAMKFTPRGGNIRVSAKLVGGTRKADRTNQTLSAMNEEEKSFLKISFHNSGPGIPKKYHKKIFAKFFQLNHKGLTGEKGSGLGLAISKEVIEHHGGRIWVESEAGQGVTFMFTLPLNNTP